MPGTRLLRVYTPGLMLKDPEIGSNLTQKLQGLHMSRKAFCKRPGRKVVHGPREQKAFHRKGSSFGGKGLLNSNTNERPNGQVACTIFAL